MKILTKVLLIIGIIIFLGFAGCKGLINHIYNRTDCEQFNIDNIEVRTGIDIPAVSKVICDFNAIENTKTSIFTLDKTQVNLAHYAARNGFHSKGNVYVNAGERTDTKWEASLNKTTLDLTVSVIYK